MVFGMRIIDAELEGKFKRKIRNQSHDQLRITIMIINIYVTIKRLSNLPIPCQRREIVTN